MKKIALILFLLAFIFIATSCGDDSPWIWLGSSDDGGNDSAAVAEEQDAPDEPAAETTPSAPDEPAAASTPSDDAVPHTDNDDEQNGDDEYSDRILDERLFGIWTTDLSETGDFFDVDLSRWELTYEFREDGTAIKRTASVDFNFTYAWYVDDDLLYMRYFLRSFDGGRNYRPDGDNIYEVVWITDDNISIHSQTSTVHVLYRVPD